MPTATAKKWPASAIEMVKLDDLLPYIRNPRQHSPDQIRQIAASMREFGWTMPILRDEEGTILAGHGRVMAARELGLTEGPCMTARGWPESKKRAYVIADNKLALNASWDTGLLSAEIEALAEAEYPIDVLGFSEDDMLRMADDLMAKSFTESQSEAPAVAPPADAEAPPPAPANSPDSVPMTITMTVAQREGIFLAIQKAKDEYGLDHSAEALWQICKLFLDQK